MTSRVNITELKKENEKKFVEMKEKLEATTLLISELNSKIELLRGKLRTIYQVVKIKSSSSNFGENREKRNSQKSETVKNSENSGKRTKICFILILSLFF